jgi:hypothetical protein
LDQRIVCTLVQAAGPAELLAGALVVAKAAFIRDVLLQHPPCPAWIGLQEPDHAHIHGVYVVEVRII